MPHLQTSKQVVWFLAPIYSWVRKSRGESLCLVEVTHSPAPLLFWEARLNVYQTPTFLCSQEAMWKCIRGRFLPSPIVICKKVFNINQWRNMDLAFLFTGSFRAWARTIPGTTPLASADFTRGHGVPLRDEKRQDMQSCFFPVHKTSLKGFLSCLHFIQDLPRILSSIFLFAEGLVKWKKHFL